MQYPSILVSTGGSRASSSVSGNENSPSHRTPPGLPVASRLLQGLGQPANSLTNAQHLPSQRLAAAITPGTRLGYKSASPANVTTTGALAQPTGGFLVRGRLKTAFSSFRRVSSTALQPSPPPAADDIASDQVNCLTGQTKANRPVQSINATAGSSFASGFPSPSSSTGPETAISTGQSAPKLPTGIPGPGSNTSSAKARQAPSSVGSKGTSTGATCGLRRPSPVPARR
ncbi:unnamed protein product [Protopolystoma xenopodis]|uniref:Uncharacterized protein n=1 Tax=Protopolystoma xenopodis TaxID=117903 RepID=A0A3S4ZF28_9PLAT|nr:unnamed protein product [Protopolystoma xenopodis]